MSARKAPRTSPRKNPAQSRSQVTVDAILKASGQVLVDHGYEGMTTNQVARVAGVSIGSLYQYFPSKDALIAALVEAHVDRMTAGMRDKLAEVATQPLRVVIRAMVAAMFEAHAVEPRLHRALIEQVPRVDRLEKLLVIDREMETLVSALLAVRRVELRREKLEAAAFVLVNTIEAVTHATVVDERPRIPREDLVEELTDMVSRYLLA